MKHWLPCGLLFLFSLGAMRPWGARAAEIWSGVVVIADGQAQGTWKPEPATEPAAGQWERWEQMEKMTRAEELRRSAPPNAILMPDGYGRSVLAVAPWAGIKGWVVDAGTGMVDLRRAEVVDFMVRLSGSGQVMARDSLLSNFHVAESAGALPGGTIVVERCAVTGSFGGVYWGGTQRWVVRECHFRQSHLPWVNFRAGQVPVVERCHFEKCYLPESFLVRCQDCTFEDCVIGSPETFASGAGKPLVLTVTGSANQVLPRRPGSLDISFKSGEAHWRFWGGWQNGDGPEGTAALECRMAGQRQVQPQPLSLEAEQVPDAAVRAGLKGKVLRRLDSGERLQFEDSAVKVMEQGEIKISGEVQSRAGRTMEWMQTVRDFETENGFGGTLKAGGKLKRKGVFSPDFSLLVVIEEVPGSAPDPVRVFRTLPADLPTLPELAGQVVGTTWALDGPEAFVLRFETPTQLVWCSGSKATRGESQWRALPSDDQLVMAQWLDGPAVVKLESAPQSLSISNAAGQSWKGNFVRRDLPGDFISLTPGPVPEGSPPAVVMAAEGTTKDPAEAPAQENPFEPDKVQPSPANPAPPAAAPLVADSLKSRTSRVNGLLVAELEGGKIAGATSQMNIVAVPQSVVAESTLAFNQKIGPMMEKALQEVRKFQTIRQGKWPAGYQMEISFADKYTAKDGPSAAVACALLMEGLFTGAIWDSAMAVTGDLNADGSVQPVGGVPAKIRGAVGRKCRIVGIPADNERAVRDYFLSEGPQSLMGINVFTVKEFDQARDLALAVKSPDLTTALAEFDRVIQVAPAKEKAGPWLKQAAVAAQLRKVVKAAPHHLSAKLLLEYAEGRAPLTLSLTGSLEAIDRESYEVLQAIQAAKENASFSGIRQDKLGDAISRLRRLRSTLHPDTRPLLDSMESFSTVVRTFLNNPPRTPAFINKAIEGIRAGGGTVDRQYQALRNNPEVMAELMKE